MLNHPVGCWLRSLAPAMGLLLMCLAPTSAMTEDFDAALAAARRGDFAQAYCVWKPLAEAGHAASQYHLGWMYANGEGLKVNEKLAVSWWRAAADQGHTEAQSRLGMAYLYGEGVKEDHGKAVRWFVAVARKGDEDAQALLRRLAADGDEAAMSLVARLLIDGREILGNGRRIRVDKANLRSGPGKQFKVVTVVSRGTELVEFQRSGAWVQIGLAGTPSLVWVHDSLIEEVSSRGLEGAP